MTHAYGANTIGQSGRILSSSICGLDDARHDRVRDDRLLRPWINLRRLLRRSRGLRDPELTRPLPDAVRKSGALLLTVSGGNYVAVLVPVMNLQRDNVHHNFLLTLLIPRDELRLWVDSDQAAPVGALRQQVVHPGVVSEGHGSGWRNDKLSEFLSTLLKSIHASFPGNFCYASHK